MHFLGKEIHAHYSGNNKNRTSDFLNELISAPLLRKIRRWESGHESWEKQYKQCLRTCECIHERHIPLSKCHRIEYECSDTNTFSKDSSEDKFSRHTACIFPYGTSRFPERKYQRKTDIEALLKKECCLQIATDNDKLGQDILEIVAETCEKHYEECNIQYLLSRKWLEKRSLNRKYQSSTHEQEKSKILPRMWKLAENNEAKENSPKRPKFIDRHHARCITVLECLHIEKSCHCRDNSHQERPRENIRIKDKQRKPIRTEQYQCWDFHDIHKKQSTGRVLCFIRYPLVKEILDSEEKWRNESEGYPSHWDSYGLSIRRRKYDSFVLTPLSQWCLEIDNHPDQYFLCNLEIHLWDMRKYFRYSILIDRMDCSEYILSFFCEGEYPDPLILLRNLAHDKTLFLKHPDFLGQIRSRTIRSREELLARVDSWIYHTHDRVCTDIEMKLRKNIFSRTSQYSDELEQRINELCTDHIYSLRRYYIS